MTLDRTKLRVLNMGLEKITLKKDTCVARGRWHGSNNNSTKVTEEVNNILTKYPRCFQENSSLLCDKI
ncbi:unnamed protein product [Ceutorhynchus assimilis]|uniref:Uncharacterized protein n=1 Tax=Ceutorhynchus assimilis TaxID=467358 RepID=A0A9N9QN31_9CUCU|nr:unnamed protein product [Ceutorhynchus assimilis]